MSGTQAQTRFWNMQYDARNRMTSYTDPFGHNVGYGFDAADNVTTLTDAAGRATIYGYDPMNRVSTVTTGTEQIIYGWNPNSLLGSVTYTNGMTRSYSYNNGNQLQSVKNTFVAADPSHGITEHSQEFDYGYDGNSNRLSETRQVDTKPARNITYSYDELDRLQTATYANGDGTPAANYTYGYDAVGNRSTVSGKDFNGASVSLGFTYDNLNRLATETGDPAGPITFGYDNNGNLNTKAQGSQTTTYNYDVRDQLRTVKGSGGSQVAAFDYDFERRRLAKTTASTSLTYAYDGDQVVDEFSNTGALVNRYDWGADLARGEIGGEGERFYFTDGLGSVTALSGLPGASAAASQSKASQLASTVSPERLSGQQGGPGPAPAPDATTTGSATDAAKPGPAPTSAESTAAVSPTALGPADKYEYDAWGTVISAPTSLNTFGYTGQKLDSETGLMALGNGERYYSPGLGRFQQEDSFGGSLEIPRTLNSHA
ncbi:MAG: RHS repeat-associated core domain-containing protein, partial [Blastocatellia bacterium]